MDDSDSRLARVVRQALTGRGAHVLTAQALDGFDWRLAGERSDGFPHTLFGILNHLVYWQEFSLSWIDGDKPPTPECAADSWPGAAAPVSGAEWDRVVAAFKDGLERLEERATTLDLEAARGAKTVGEILQLIASHNSYHVGQIAAARQLLRSWPPPGGGATW